MTKSDLLKYALVGIDERIKYYKERFEYYKNKGQEKNAQRYFNWLSELKYERESIEKKYLKYSLDRYYGEFHGFD